MEFAEGRLSTRKEGSMGWLTFNQPERLNAVRLDMWQALPEAIANLNRDGDIRTIVVTGAGNRAFISGADIAEFDEVRFDSISNRAFTETVTAATASLGECPKPIIAMISGFCIGGGVVIASACDIRLCASGSRFGVPAGKLGLGYELDNYKRLFGIVGAGVAMEMLCTGRQLTDLEALQAGFVNRILPASELDATVRDYAAMIGENAPMSLAAAKLCNRAALDHTLDEAAQLAIDACFDSADFREGRAAFREKRHPAFSGR